MSDPMLERIWKVRRDIAREFDYDPYKYARYVQAQQEEDKARGVAYVTREDLRHLREQAEEAKTAPQTAPRPPGAKRASRGPGRGRVGADGRGGAAPSRRETPAGNPAR